MSVQDQRLGLTAMQAVGLPKAVQKLAFMLLILFIALPPILLLAPWQQNVAASGRVTALDPLDRTQVIPAPVTGRLVELLVQEGAYVEEGEVLARMADQDPQYEQRLEQQVSFAQEKVDAAVGMFQFYEDQLELLRDARLDAIDSAKADVEVAKSKVEVEELDLLAAKADFAQKEADLTRQRQLFEKGVGSEVDFQLAEAAFLAAEAKVKAGQSKIQQAKDARDAKQADLRKVGSDLLAKIADVESKQQEAVSKENVARKELAEATTKYERQRNQIVYAPRTGYILRVYAASNADFLAQGQPLIELIPETDLLAVELWVQGVDAPLITPGRKVRLQFEGWPAVQFAGWPSVAVGTFGGKVLVVDAQGGPDGRFRVLVVPDLEDEPWPDRMYLRQGVRANGWLLLETVSLGYEMWRILNAFPPSVQPPNEKAPKSQKPKSGAKKG